jgi:hypothetical protein
MTLVWKSDVQPVNARMTLLALADNANDRGLCWPSTAHLAGKTGLSRRTVFRVLAQLSEEGLIERLARTHPSGAQAASAYRIDVEALRARRHELPDHDEETADLERRFAAAAGVPAGHPPYDSSVTPPMTHRHSPHDTAVTQEPSLEPSLEPSEATPLITADAATGADLQPDEPTLPGMPATASKAKSKPGHDEAGQAFEQWWRVYPRKTGKIAARKQWDTVLRKGLTDVETLILGAKRYAAAVEGSQFVKYPKTWLSDGCWDDEVVPPSDIRPAASNRYQPYRDDPDEDAYTGPIE